VRGVAATFTLPIAIERGASLPIHRQIYEWFQSAIAEGRLRPGGLVPSSRGLASELGVSRIPVVNAYEQLRAEGYFETLVGVGTRVAKFIPIQSVTVGKAPQPGVISGSASKSTGRQISRRAAVWNKSPMQPWVNGRSTFRVSLPALDHFPIDIWSKLIAVQSKAISRSMLAYGDAMGYGPLREAIADYVRAVRGVRCEASQILVTTGSQQGLQIALQVLLNPGDRVCVEDPGYPGARQAFAMADAEIIPIKVDTEGIVVSELLRKGGLAKLVYVTPSHQYPMGMTMSAARRMQLLNWAARNGTWIIEDDYDSEYRYDSRPIASLQGLDSNARVLYMGTFSNVMFPALRLGYLVLPPNLIAACRGAKNCMDIFCPTLNQAVLEQFIHEGHFARHLRRMRMLYIERRKALVSALQSNLGSSVEISGAEAGMHLVILLRPGVDDLTVSTDAAHKGVAVMPLSSCRISLGERGGLILGYGGVSVQSIHDGVRKLRDCLERTEGQTIRQGLRCE
jgi:GntR family transcriptional regulator / MocR family aminotransferase